MEAWALPTCQRAVSHEDRPVIPYHAQHLVAANPLARDLPVRVAQVRSVQPLLHSVKFCKSHFTELQDRDFKHVKYLNRPKIARTGLTTMLVTQHL